MSPLIAQTSHDFAGGSFSVNIADDYAEDMTDYESAYPELIDQTIVKLVLTNGQPGPG